MITFKAIASGVALAAVAATVAAADEFKHYGQAGGWNVFTNLDEKTCVAELNNGGAIVQMGLTHNKKLAYLGVFTKDEDGVSKGDKGDFVIDVAGQTFHGDVTGMSGNITEGYSGAYVLADNPDFIDALAGASMLKAVNAEVIVEVNLGGIGDAIAMGRECIAAAM